MPRERIDASETAGYPCRLCSRCGARAAAGERIQAARVDVLVKGPRDGLQAVAAAAQMNAEDLSVLAGLSLSAAQSALTDAQDGRLRG